MSYFCADLVVFVGRQCSPWKTQTQQTNGSLHTVMIYSETLFPTSHLHFPFTLFTDTSTSYDLAFFSHTFWQTSAVAWLLLFRPHFHTKAPQCLTIQRMSNCTYISTHFAPLKQSPTRLAFGDSTPGQSWASRHRHRRHRHRRHRLHSSSAVHMALALVSLAVTRGMALVSLAVAPHMSQALQCIFGPQFQQYALRKFVMQSHCSEEICQVVRIGR